MRMISKIKDYYDGVARNTVSDKTHTFVRETKEIETIDINVIYCDEYETKKNKLTVSYYVLGFCGEIYPYIEVEKAPLEHPYGPSTKSFYFDWESAKEKFPWKSLKRSRYWYYWSSGDIETRVENWLDKGIVQFYKKTYDLKNDSKVKELFLKHRVAYFHIGRQTKHGEHVVTSYPVLKDIEFGKVFDAYTCFQKIEMFLTNEIVKPDEIPQHIQDSITDDLKAHSHGYDKWSFRKEPGGKKRKKK